MGLPGKVGAATIARRVSTIVDLAEQLTADRAQQRIGSVVEVLVEEVDTAARLAEGRAAHQAPEVDGSCTVHWRAGADAPAVGDLVRAEVVASNGVDLVTEAGRARRPCGADRAPCGDRRRPDRGSPDDPASR